jgi:3' exoribonuclease, RNase T-like
MTMNHAMIDLETMSTRSDARVLSVGVAIFNDTEVIATDGWAIDIADDIGGHVDWKTVKWWMEQDADARAFSWNGKLKNGTAAYNFKTFLAQHGIEFGKESKSEVWSKDPHFDHVILENWWRRVNEVTLIGDFPIGYRQPRAYRTLVWEANELGFEEEHAGFYVAHNPVDDAAIQARVVIQARQFLRNAVRPIGVAA